MRSPDGRDGCAEALVNRKDAYEKLLKGRPELFQDVFRRFGAYLHGFDTELLDFLEDGVP